MDTYPVVFGAGASIGSDVFQIGVTADWWFVLANLFDFLNFYVGSGLYGQISNSFGLGVRIPIGFQIFIWDPFELFLEIAPALGILIANPIKLPAFGMQGAFGFRIWF